jgi:hypothetical protein
MSGDDQQLNGQEAGGETRRTRTEEVPVNGTEEKASKTPAEIEAEIAHQREELAETLDALGAKLDVKAQTRAKVAEAKGRATTDNGKPRPELVAAAVVVVAGTVALVWWRRSR